MMKTILSRTRTLVTAGAVALVLASGSLAFAYSVTRVGRVEAFDTDTWTLRVTPGQTRITVNGDNDTDLDCFVYDSYGRLLDSDTDSTDYCILNVNQMRSGNVRLEIANLGDVWNEYVLTME